MNFQASEDTRDSDTQINDLMKDQYLCLPIKWIEKEGFNFDRVVQVFILLCFIIEHMHKIKSKPENNYTT